MERRFAKTLTFALLHFSVGFSVTYALTGSVAIAGSVALIEPLVNSVVFYFHELGWQRADEKMAATSGHVDRRFRDPCVET